MHTAVKSLKASAELPGLPMPAIAIRCLVHHSALIDGDSTIIGPQAVDQLDQCVDRYNVGRCLAS